MTGAPHGVGAVNSGNPKLAMLKAARFVSAVSVITYPAPDSGVGFARSTVVDPIPENAGEIPMQASNRLVANFFTPEFESTFSDLHVHHARHGGELIRGFVARVSTARADGIGGGRGLRPAMSVIQWRLGA